MEMRDFSGQKIMVVSLLIVLILFVGSSITGYTTSLVNLQKEVSNATACADVTRNLESFTAKYEECTGMLNSTSSLFTRCKSDLARANADVMRLTSENILYEKNVTELGRNVTNLGDMLNNAANRICCTIRAVNNDASIRYFYLSGGEVHCINTADASRGTVEIQC